MDVLGPTTCQRHDSVKITVSAMWPEHMDAVEEIEEASFEFPWDRDRLEAERKKKYNLVLVATTVVVPTGKRLIVGSLFAESDRFRYTLINLAVHPRWRRLGVGRALIEKVISRLRRERRYEIYELVRESNLNAQNFYKQLGFVAIKSIPDYYDNGNAAYQMVFKWEWSPQGIRLLGPPAKCKKRNHKCLLGTGPYCDCD
jgi:[ribosomal protein S18]-alanine N-acetyltransferase